MNITIAKQWAAELRSGKYQQGTRSLCCMDKYCCLGVLCEMATASGIVARVPQGELKGYVGASQKVKTGVLPIEVMEWAGVKDSEGRFGRAALTDINDNGATFPEIADLIEKHAEAL